MDCLRAFFRGHQRLAALLVALALAMKTLVPAGYMVGTTATALTVEICADASGVTMTRQIVVPHSGKHEDAGKAAAACPYAGLGMASLPGADVVLLTLALAFILALAFARPRAAPPRRIQDFRPPLRGPPSLLPTH